MTNPTIHSQTLSTGGTRTIWHTPTPRLTQSTVPTVKGVYVQRFPSGGQLCTGTGSLSNATLAGLKTALRTIQKAAGGAPATYTDGDGATHLSCILLDYKQAPQINRGADGEYWVSVSWAILKQVP